jgi:hypothetical protein
MIFKLVIVFVVISAFRFILGSRFGILQKQKWDLSM